MLMDKLSKNPLPELQIAAIDCQFSHVGLQSRGQKQ